MVSKDFQQRQSNDGNENLLFTIEMVTQ